MPRCPLVGDATASQNVFMSVVRILFYGCCIRYLFVVENVIVACNDKRIAQSLAVKVVGRIFASFHLINSNF